MNFALLLGKFTCIAMRKHKRGKRISVNAINGLAMFKCPRCETNWLRKVAKTNVAT